MRLYEVVLEWSIYHYGRPEKGEEPFQARYSATCAWLASWVGEKAEVNDNMFACFMSVFFKNLVFCTLLSSCAMGYSRKNINRGCWAHGIFRGIKEILKKEH